MKKVVVLLLAVALLLSMTACGKDEKTKQTGGNTSTVDGDPDAPTFVVDAATAKAGETVTVAVRTVNNPGIVSLKLVLDYDANVLELLETAEQDFAGITYGPLDKVPFNFLWIDAVHPDNTTDGVITLLTFRVLEDAPLGKTALTLSYDQEDVFNAEWEDVVFAIRSAYVTVEE